LLVLHGHRRSKRGARGRRLLLGPVLVDVGQLHRAPNKGRRRLALAGFVEFDWLDHRLARPSKRFLDATH
jgi:hypothetical protein